MRCLYCGYSEGGHDLRCPESMSGEEKAQAHKFWRVGYDHGRSGDSEEELDEPHPSYDLGYGRGVVVLEELENGHDPRFAEADYSGDSANVSADPAYYDSDDLDC